MCCAHGTSIVSRVQLLSARHPCFFNRWGTMYVTIGPRNSGLFRLAVSKLLFDGRPYVQSLSSFTVNQECAVLSQRIALEINSNINKNRNFDMSEKVQLQIANHMRVC